MSRPRRESTRASPVVRRLVGCAKSTSTTVLLFCRLQNPKTGPYVMCGRLRYVSHNFSRRPLKFTWELEDREALRGIDAFAEMVALK